MKQKLTQAQIQKNYRDRQKLKAAGLLPEPNLPPKLNLPTTGLSKFIKAQGQESLDSAGFIHEEITGLDLRFLEDGSKQGQEIAMVESTINKLTQGLEYLTAVLSEFRQHQVSQEIARVTQKDLADPAKREQGLARILQLTKAMERLKKKYRLELSEYEVLGG